jgi:hypothetical protein
MVPATGERGASVSDSDMAGRAAGWYQDPQGGRSQRYWDGLAWTSFVRDDRAASAPPDTDLYQPPFSSAPSAAGGATPGVRAVASAQKLVLYAIALYIVAVVLRIGIVASVGDAAAATTTLGGLDALIALAAIVMALVGVYRLASAFGYSMVVRVLCLVLMFVPLVGLITLVVLNRRATSLLRGAGLRVGLLGVRR